MKRRTRVRAGGQREFPRLVKDNLPDKADPPPNEAEAIPASKVVSDLKTFGRNWDAEVEKLLSLPKELFLSKRAGMLTYSDVMDSGLEMMAHNISAGRFYRPKADYGIVLHETGSSVYFYLFDARRRIIVREPLQSFHSIPPEREWSHVKNGIRAAVALADTAQAKKGELFAFYDGFPRLVTPFQD